jgi:hypothetical protein
MFRIVISFVPQPVFWMVCDELTCGTSKMKPVDLSKSLVTIGSDNRPRLMKQAQQDFCEEAGKEGWLVALNMMLCPGHHQHKIEQERAQREQRIVVPAHRSRDTGSMLPGTTAQQRRREVPAGSR